MTKIYSDHTIPYGDVKRIICKFMLNANLQDLGENLSLGGYIKSSDILDPKPELKLISGTKFVFRFFTCYDKSDVYLAFDSPPYRIVTDSAGLCDSPNDELKISNNNIVCKLNGYTEDQVGSFLENYDKLNDDSYDPITSDQAGIFAKNFLGTYTPKLTMGGGLYPCAGFAKNEVYDLLFEQYDEHGNLPIGLRFFFGLDEGMVNQIRIIFIAVRQDRKNLITAYDENGSNSRAAKMLEHSYPPFRTGPSTPF